MSVLACSDDPSMPDATCAACTPDAASGGVDAATADPGLDATAAFDAAASALDAAADASEADDGGITWPTGPIRTTRYRIADPAMAVPPCALAGSGSIVTHDALLGQTHLTPGGWPFQTVSANRPLTVAVSATGSGPAPAFTATARANGEELTICLTGANTLAANASAFEATVYRGALPARMVVPGLEVTVSAGGWTETLTPDVQAENGLTVYLVRAQLFGEGDLGLPADAQLTELLARLPSSYLDVGIDPFGVWQPTKLLVSPRDDGRLPNGDPTSHAAIVITENPHCSSDDESNGTCTLHSGYGTMSAVLDTLDAFREANGLGSASTWYAHLAVGLGGGLGGGQRATGDNTELVMNHELGHAWGFPHWAAADTEYPYEGVQRERGGFGDRWAIDQARDLLISPICEGLERQSPMQRADACVPQGSWFDPFSDYEAMRLVRMTLGAESELTGDVAYTGGTQGAATRSYVLREEDGRQHMRWNSTAAGMTFERYDPATQAFQPEVSDAWDRIATSETPVVMFVGAVIVGGDAYVEAPIEYVGNVLEPLDPTDPDDYDYLYEHRSSEFYWAQDLVLRFTLDDGTVFSRLYGGEAELREAGDHERFAFNLPSDVGARVKKLEVLSRPLGHFSDASKLQPTDSASNYLSAAQVLTTWMR